MKQEKIDDSNKKNDLEKYDDGNQSNFYSNNDKNDENIKDKIVIDKRNSSFKNINNFLNKRTNFKVYELILFGFLIMVVSVFTTVAIIYEVNNNDNTKNVKISSEKSDSLAEFEEVYELIKSSYFTDVDDDKLINGAINGMLDSLDDPHTSYFNKSETENFNELMNGSYEGIGAEISIDSEGNIIILSVFKNSPAAEAGLKFNDIIKEVNGKSTEGMSTTEVVALIKDKDKKIANIKINRNGQDLNFEVEKRIVIIESVESKTFKVNNKKIGYVIINNFANNTYDQFRSNVESLEKENISGLVIDVRGNSGGYLHSVTNMLDMFLSKGTIIYQIADKKQTNKYFATTNESRNYPVAVLVNKASASASEILAISLKESYGADVIGTRTYGKGTVQTTKDLQSGGMIKYTIQKWLSPEGNWINKIGVEPTYEIELSSEYENNPTYENDNQLQKALNVVANK